MAKTEKADDVQVPETDAQATLAAEAARAGQNFDASDLVSDAEAAKVAEAFHRGEMPSGYKLRFVTRGSEPLPIVRKIG